MELPQGSSIVNFPVVMPCPAQMSTRMSCWGRPWIVRAYISYSLSGAPSSTWVKWRCHQLVELIPGHDLASEFVTQDAIHWPVGDPPFPLSHPKYTRSSCLDMGGGKKSNWYVLIAQCKRYYLKMNKNGKNTKVIITKLTSWSPWHYDQGDHQGSPRCVWHIQGDLDPRTGLEAKRHGEIFLSNLMVPATAWQSCSSVTCY